MKVESYAIISKMAMPCLCLFPHGLRDCCAIRTLISWHIFWSMLFSNIGWGFQCFQPPACGAEMKFFSKRSPIGGFTRMPGVALRLAPRGRLSHRFHYYPEQNPQKVSKRSSRPSKRPRTLISLFFRLLVDSFDTF